MSFDLRTVPSTFPVRKPTVVGRWGYAVTFIASNLFATGVDGLPTGR
jgi:hypothetical protein